MVLRHGRDEDLSAVSLVALASHETCLLEPIDHAGDGASGQPRDLGKAARGHAALEVEKIQAFKVGTGDSGYVGNGLPVQHTLGG